MRTFTVINLHQLTDSEVQFNMNKLNDSDSNNIGSSYQRRCWGNRKAMVDKINVALGTLYSSFQILGTSHENMRTKYRYLDSKMAHQNTSP